jgi:O-antigen/teichoic acid export membrane protein
VEGLSVQERSVGPADVLSHGRRAVHLLRTPLFTNAFYLWASVAGGAIAGFAFWAMAARLYDTDEVGLGSAALSIMTLLAMFSHLGLGMGLIRFLPESGARGPRLANAVFTTSAVGAVVLSIGFLIGVPLWAPRLDFLREQPLYTMAFISFVLAASLYVVQTHAFVAIRKAKYFFIQVVFVQLSRLALPALMAIFFGAFGVLASGGIATALGAVIGFALLARGLPGYRPRAVADPASVFKLFPFSVANYIADSLLLTPGLILPLVVVGLLGSTEAAYFYMAWFLGYLLTSASAYLALSLFAEGSHDPGALRVLSRNAVLGGLAVATLGAMFLLLLGDKLLLAFGQDYATGGATLLRIVALAALPAAVVNVYLGALRVMKRTGELMIVAGVVAVTTVALSCALLPVMGLTGAGIGHGLGQGLGLAIILSRLLTTSEGTTTERVRWLLATLAGRSQVAAHQYARGSGDAKAT